MTGTRIETAKLSALNDLPVQGRVVSWHLAKRIAEWIKSDNVKVTPIRVGKIGDKIYPINDFETVMALRSANMDQIPIMVSDYSSMKDLLAAHVEKNFHPHGTMISNENSLWVPLLSLKTMLAKYHEKTTESPVEERVAETSSITDLGKKSKTKQSAEKTVEKASRYIESDPNLL